MKLEQAKGIFNANYKKEWVQSDNPKRRKAVTEFWNMYVEQLLYTDGKIDEQTANQWLNNYYTVN